MKSFYNDMVQKQIFCTVFARLRAESSNEQIEDHRMIFIGKDLEDQPVPHCHYKGDLPQTGCSKEAKKELKSLYNTQEKNRG